MLARLIEQRNTRLLNLHLSVPGMTLQNELDQALLTACKLGYSEGVKSLLNANADPNSAFRSDTTTMDYAIDGGSSNIVEMLLDFGFNSNHVTRDFNTLLHRAILVGKIDCAKALVVTGHCDINAANKYGNTPLLLSIKHDKYEITEFLLGNDVDINARNVYGWTALHYAAQKGIGVERLLKERADPNISNNDGTSPLLLSAAEGFSHAAIALLDASADPNAFLPDSKRSALHILSMKGHLDAVEHLVEKGANVDWRDANGMTALCYAIEHERTDVAMWLFRISTSVRCSSSNPQMTCPLYLAIKRQCGTLINAIFITGFDQFHARSVLQDPEISLQILNTVGEPNYSHYAAKFSSPLPLKLLCRLEVRCYLGSRVFNDITNNKITIQPKRMLSYLLLSELDQ